VKNAPAVTARRATNQIVLEAEHQALAAIVVVILAAAAEETLAIVVVVGIVLVVIVLAEQTVRVVTMRLIDPAVTVHRLIDLVAMVRPVRRARLAIVPIPRGLHAMEIVHTRLGPHVTEILDRRGPAATAPTRLVLLATERDQTVREVTVRIALVAIGLTVLALIVRIVHALIALTATSPAVSGSPMGESVVRSARR